MLKLGPDEKPDLFNFEVEKQGKFTFKTSHRDQLLCQFFECCTKATGKFKNFGPYRSLRLRKSQHRVECKLAVASFGIIELSESGKVLQEYRWVNIKKIGSDERDQAIFFDYSGRIKIFYVPNDMNAFLSSCNSQLAQIGIVVKILNGQTLQEIVKIRLNNYATTGLAVSFFNVNKQTSRSPRLIPRQLHITELFIVEKDISGFQYVSYHPLTAVYAVVRCWNDPRKFTIEYLDGSNSVYHCTVRDTLLSLLQDVCHAAGNIKVIITGEVSDNLRLIPRFAEEHYESRLLDSIFGAFSIEVWFLRQLKKAVETLPIQLASVIQICREFNANVPFPGISLTSDEKLVKTCLNGVMKWLHAHIKLTPNFKFVVENPRGVAVVLQTVYRMLPSATGYKCLVQISEVDPKHILLGLIKCEVDFVNYWAIQVLKFLCSCPLESRNTQQEYVNKHTLLTDKLLKSLLDLMGVRITEPLENLDDDVEGKETDESEKQTDPTDHYATDVPPPQPKTPWSQTSQATQVAAAGESAESSDPSSERKVTEFFPNSLVIVGSAELLESIVSSRRDTSSPEMLNIVLDLLAERFEILIHMLRSTSFLIMENAAILLHILIKNRKETAPLLQEAALSDCLVLKHFYNGVFSPSASQRFISRFLCSTWMSGPESSPGKKLLRRLLPSGLLEYLKHIPITAEHRAALDDMEDEFYATYGGSAGSQAQSKDNERKKSLPGGDLQTRMRNRIASALKNAAVTRSAEDEPASSTQPENFRIMFHVMTQDHQLADLVWNEQTRIELRSTLEMEITEYEREQRLRGHKMIAWNYEQFYVKYQSLKYMLQVMPFLFLLI